MKAKGTTTKRDTLCCYKILKGEQCWQEKNLVYAVFPLAIADHMIWPEKIFCVLSERLCCVCRRI